MVGVSNFRHAQYDAQGVGIDNPQELFRTESINILRAHDGRTSRPTIGVCGTSITETRPYLSSTGFLDLGNGTYSLTFGSSVRPFLAEKLMPLSVLTLGGQLSGRTQARN